MINKMMPFPIYVLFSLMGRGGRCCSEPLISQYNRPMSVIVDVVDVFYFFNFHLLPFSELNY